LNNTEGGAAGLAAADDMEEGSPSVVRLAKHKITIDEQLGSRGPDTAGGLVSGGRNIAWGLGSGGPDTAGVLGSGGPGAGPLRAGRRSSSRRRREAETEEGGDTGGGSGGGGEAGLGVARRWGHSDTGGGTGGEEGGAGVQPPGEPQQEEVEMQPTAVRSV